MLRSQLARALVTGTTFCAVPAFADDAPAALTYETAEGEITVLGNYSADGLSLPQQQLPVLDTPQSVTVIADDLLAEQGRRTLRDALRNITGVSFQAGEGNPPGGGDAFNVRGFSARDDIFVDGIRDPGNYFRDPFYADRIEVTKGPASAFAGRGNVGGTVNIVTRQANLKDSFFGEAVVGTDNFFRGTVDVNRVLDTDNGIAVRLTAMGHSADEPGRDFVENRRWAIAPSIGFGLGGDTTVVINYLHLEQDDVPDLGLPNARNTSLVGSGFEGRVAPVNRNNFYGYSTDYRTVTTDTITGRIDHRFTDDLAVANITRFARVGNDFVASAPRFVGAVTTLDQNTQAVGNFKARDQVDTLFINQTTLTANFGSDAIQHTLVVGGEYISESNENRRRLDANGPARNLFNPSFGPAQILPFNGTRARIDLETFSLFVFDTIELGEQFRVVAGLRNDWVETRVRGFDDNGIAPGFVTDLSRNDSALSGNLSLVFKPTENSSIYAAFGTAFQPGSSSEVIQLAGGNNNPPVTPANFAVDPETSKAFEVGGKLELMDNKLLLSAAVFQITRDNARTPGINPGDPAVVLEGEQRVRGFELQAVGNLTPRWNIFAGYSYLDGKVTRSNRAFEVGQRMPQAPEHSATAWTSYAVTDAFMLGGGIQHMSSRTSDIRPGPTSNLIITAPSFTVFDAFAEYQINQGINARINIYNVTDQTYFLAFGSAQSIPAAARSGTFTLTFKY